MHRTLLVLPLLALLAGCNDSPVAPRREAPVPPTTDVRDVAGTYQLTITASESCATSAVPLPSSAAQRTYTATLTQDGRSLTAQLNSATIMSGQGIFYGSITGDHVIFSMSGWDEFLDEEGPAFVEQLSDHEYLAVTGEASATSTADGFAGTLRGSLIVRDDPDFGAVVGSCAAPDHGFVLSRR